MWTRAQLKERGKVTFRANYWKAILVALIITLVVGSTSGSAGYLGGLPASLPFMQDRNDSVYEYVDLPDDDVLGSNPEEPTDAIEDGAEVLSEDIDKGSGELAHDLEKGNSTREELDDLWGILEDNGVEINGDYANVHIGEDGVFVETDDGDRVWLGEGGIDVTREDGTSTHIDDADINHFYLNGNEYDLDEMFASNNGFWGSIAGLSAIAIAALVGLVILLALVILVIAFAIDAFLLNPIEVGARRFFLTNLNRKAEVKEVAFAFDHEYLNGVKTMFLRDLFTFLWSLLFIIPGIVKSYEYRMIPYLLAEHPEMDYKTAFATSKQMMHGNKWSTFVLDLSFLGWWILSALTCGILGLFYVDPYYNATCAALYETLAYGHGQSDPVGQHSNPADPFAPSTPPYGNPAPNMSDQPTWATAQQVPNVQMPNVQPTTPMPAQPAAPTQAIPNAPELMPGQDRSLPPQQ